jgi:alkylhydroperoxidase family enzyme
MPRIPYLPADLREPAEVVTAIRQRRGGPLLNLDRMLLYSPPLAKGWNAFLGEVRGGLALPPKLRELAMCVVAVLNGADYEFLHHAPEFARAGGTPAQISALADPQRAVRNDSVFDTAERATIRLTIDMTNEVKVSDLSFQAVRMALPDQRQLVELVGVIAAYNMVSRFLVALGVDAE